MERNIDLIIKEKAHELEENRKRRVNAILLTAGVYAALLAFVIFVRFGAKDPPYERIDDSGAVGVILGDPDAGMGGLQEVMAGIPGEGDNTAQPGGQPKETIPTVSPESPDNFNTDPNSDAPVINSPPPTKKKDVSNEKPVTNTRPTEQQTNTPPKRRVNQDDLFSESDGGGNNGANGTGGENRNSGLNGKPGVQGDRNGVPGGGGGMGGPGVSLAGRTVVSKDNCNIKANRKGTLVVSIVVDEDGNVISTGNVPGKGSTITDLDLYKRVQRCVSSTWKFSASTNNLSRQQGSITFEFEY